MNQRSGSSQSHAALEKLRAGNSQAKELVEKWFKMESQRKKKARKRMQLWTGGYSYICGQDAKFAGAAEVQ